MIHGMWTLVYSPAEARWKHLEPVLVQAESCSGLHWWTPAEGTWWPGRSSRSGFPLPKTEIAQNISEWFCMKRFMRRYVVKFSMLSCYSKMWVSNAESLVSHCAGWMTALRLYNTRWLIQLPLGLQRRELKLTHSWPGYIMMVTNVDQSDH